MPLPTLAPWGQAGSVDDATTRAPVFLTPLGGEPTPTQSLGTSHHSDQLNSRTHETPTETSSIGVSLDSSGPSSEPLPDESQAALQDEDNSEDAPLDVGREILSPEEKAEQEEKATVHALPNPGSADGGALLSTVGGMHTVHTNGQGKVPALYGSKGVVFETVGRIDEIAEVAQLVISPPSTHHTSVLGACAKESKAGSERCYRTLQLVSRTLHNPNII